MTEYLVETRNYLGKFFKARYPEYCEVLKELRPEQGCGFYYRCSDVTQALWNIVGNISETFDDLRIPEMFSSPKHLLDTLVNFQRLLREQNDLLLDVFKHY